MNVGRGIGEGSTTERPEGVQAADVNAGSPASAPGAAERQTGQTGRPEGVEKQ